MDVLDADELEFDVGIVVLVLVAFSRSSVCDCIQLIRQNIICHEEIHSKKKRMYGFTQIVPLES